MAPKIILSNLENNYHIITSKYQSLMSEYLDINSKLIIENLSHFKTMRFSKLLETTKALILPTGTAIRALVTSSDVIHS